MNKASENMVTSSKGHWLHHVGHVGAALLVVGMAFGAGAGVAGVGRGFLRWWNTPPIIIGGCGDGVLQQREECDDGNRRNWDGCDSDCVVELGWKCVNSPSICIVR